MENISLGQGIMLFIWLIIAIGLGIFLKSIFNNKPSAVRQAMEEEAAKKTGENSTNSH